jgi:Rieske Fe-S protein
LAELQKDPITRKDFIGFGVLGGIVGALLTIPPVAFILGPVIDVNVLGKSDVPDSWFEVGPISEVPAEEPKVFRVEFPVNQVYSEEQVRKEGVETSGESIPNAVWTSWRHVAEGGEERVMIPSFVEEGVQPPLTQAQIREATQNLNVLASSCAHLGCPVRWVTTEGAGEFLCPCHGGIYDINGEYIGGPPPRGMYHYTFEVRENGNIYVRHEFDVGGEKGPQRPYVI